MTNGHPQEGRPAYVYRSLALLNLGRLEDALTSTDELLSFIPYTRGAWFQRGHTLVRMLRFRDAEEAYRRGIELEPENAAGLRELIDLYRLHMRDYAQAEACCERLIALHPDDGANWKLKGDILFRRENYQDAESAYERALALCATDATITADVWHNYGSTLILLGRYDKALVAFDKGDAIAHAGYTSLNGRGVIMSRIERPLDALAWYEAALRLEPSIQVQSNKAEALARLGRLDEAEEIVNNILAGEPKAMGAGVVRGIVETYRERHAEAMIAFTSALALDPRHAPSYIEFARLLLVLSAADHARRVIERALALDPYDASAWQVKGQALRALGLLEEANAAEKHGATLLADQQAQMDAWLRERAQRGEPAGPR